MTENVEELETVEELENEPIESDSTLSQVTDPDGLSQVEIKDIDVEPYLLEVLKEDGEPILDEQGNPILDFDGEPLVEPTIYEFELLGNLNLFENQLEIIELLQSIRLLGIVFIALYVIFKIVRWAK